jgi:hypothetical protein
MWALDETALELVQRTWFDTPFVLGIDVFDTVFPHGLRPRTVLELYGDSSSPKSLLLMHISAAFLLQDASAEVHYFDHESMLDVHEMRCIFLAHNVDNSNDLASIMQRFFIYRVTGTPQWSAQLDTIHKQLLESRHHVNILIAIDCISSFHLIDKVNSIVHPSSYIFLTICSWPPSVLGNPWPIEIPFLRNSKALPEITQHLSWQQKIVQPHNLIRVTSTSIDSSCYRREWCWLGTYRILMLGVDHHCDQAALCAVNIIITRSHISSCA